MDNIMMNYFCYYVFYLTIFLSYHWYNDTTDNMAILFYIGFYSIEFMFIIIPFGLSNLAIDKISEISI